MTMNLGPEKKGENLANSQKITHLFLPLSG